MIMGAFVFPNKAGRFCGRAIARALFPPASATEERLAAALIYVWVLALAWRLQGFYVVPSLDWFGFRNTALSIMNFRSPANFARAPFFPLLMYAFHFVAPAASRDPMLFGAEVINVLAGLVAVVLTYRLARPVLGRWSLLVIWLLTNSYVFQESLWAPLLETLYLVTVLATLLSLGKGRYRTYLFAAAAAATRYEAIALVPLALFFDRAFLREKRRLWWAAFAALVPVGAWLALSARNSLLVNPYVEIMYFGRPVGIKFLKTLAGGLYETTWSKLVFFKHGATLAAAGGVAWLAARGGRTFRGYLVFAAVFVAVHMAFPYSWSRYTHTLLPLLFVALVAGGRWAFRLASAKAAAAKVWLYLGALAGATAAAAAAYVVWDYRASGGPLWWLNVVTPTLLLVVAAACAARGPAGGAPRRRLAAALAVALLMPFLYGNKRNFAGRYEGARYELAIYPAMAEWFDAGEAGPRKISIAAPWLLRYYLERKDVAVEGLDPFIENGRRLSTASLKGEGIDYVIYDSWFCENPDTVAKWGSDVWVSVRRRGGDARLIKTIRRGGDVAEIYAVTSAAQEEENEHAD
jgi:hypothetical protein